MSTELAPRSFEEAAQLLSGAAVAGRAVRPRGGGTKGSWAAPAGEDDLIILTERLDATLEHNVADMTAVFAAGAPLARVQAELAAAGQMLALDPPFGELDAATLGGVIASGDSGPLAHRYGGARDQVLGMTVALSDGTIARAGGRVIKNVAGYDLPRLFTGSAGTLGLILSVAVRLRTLPTATATARGTSASATALAAAAAALSAAPLELEALDLGWRGGRGGLLAQVAGSAASRRAGQVAQRMREAGLDHVDVTAADGPLWAGQRARQRSAEGLLVRVNARPSQLAVLFELADRCAATLVARAALGTAYFQLAPGALPALRAGLPAGSGATVLDSIVPLTADERFGAAAQAEFALMRAVKHQFDPSGACSPGTFVGGL